MTMRSATAASAETRRRLSQRQDLPVRVRHMLTGLFGLCTSSPALSLARVLDEFEQELSRQAVKVRSGEMRQRCSDTLREVRRKRAEVAPRFLAATENLLARFDQVQDQTDTTQPSELALVEAGELEESLTLQELATKIEIRHASALHDLGHRFAVLAQRPAFETDKVPLGPGQLLGALRDASTCLGIPADHRALLYLAYERMALGDIDRLYAALNQFFMQHRILRHLRVHAPVRARGKGSAASDSVAGAESDHQEHGAVGASARAPVGDDPELFGTLRNLLAKKRSGTGEAVPARVLAATYVASGEDVQSVLQRLQSARLGASAGSPGQVRQDLLAQLKQITPPGRQPQLSHEDSDTVDLIGMLFDYLGKSSPSAGRTQSIINKLQVPLLRVALRDKGFFSQRSHPARLLLNAITETGIHWIDDSEGEADPALMKKMHSVIERLNNEFDGDLSLIERMFADLSQHMQTLARKAEVAERRLVDASRGREKLALARETASGDIAERLRAVAKPGRLLRTMLEQAWTDVLALTLLRQGEHSDGYRRQLAVADRLISASTGGAAPEDAAALRQEVELGLGQVGYHADEIHAVVNHLLGDGASPGEENPATQTEVAVRLKAKAHLGKSAGDEAPMRSAASRRASLRLNVVEQQMLERLRTLPFGTWFEFATNQQGDRVRRKLAWYSTVTGRCLFVNARGLRAGERSLEQFARDIVRGQANFLEPEAESLVDRAWKAIVGSLRQLTGAAKMQPASRLSSLAMV